MAKVFLSQTGKCQNDILLQSHIAALCCMNHQCLLVLHNDCVFHVISLLYTEMGLSHELFLIFRTFFAEYTSKDQLIIQNSPDFFCLKNSLKSPLLLVFLTCLPLMTAISDRISSKWYYVWNIQHIGLHAGK